MEKTDSPKRELGAPKANPPNFSPDLRWRVAGSVARKTVLLLG